ncbi:GNAT family N-acetyltransferase [Pedobacter sp. Leaf194]|uniref:GNAT family N-acetyltransferase n=1 Tax=Pedobacter sp. Leaf194 TaxID=1736297 RepID=UPI0007039691|nr:GNAT family N-acetyltransferase [Pedobacter sp. Leaf194]KQS36233.1 hypothetical protein ASG14_12460 [Pedobacter sp. Leaf194]
MNGIKHEIGEGKKEAFNFYKDGNKVAGMDISTEKDILVVHQTNVDQDKQGEGYAAELIHRIIEHAKKNELSIKPVCPFVSEQLKNHPPSDINICGTE